MLDLRAGLDTLRIRKFARHPPGAFLEDAGTSNRISEYSVDSRRPRHVTRRRRKPQQPESASQTLDLIETRSDRIIEWVGTNPKPILAVAGTILAIAAVWGFTTSSREQANDESSAALARVTADFRSAMGASPGSIAIPELANAEEAAEIREEFVLEYEAVGSEFSGEPAGAVALLEAGKLQQKLGDAAGALATYEEALESLGPVEGLRGLILERRGSVYEAEGDWTSAAEAYREASLIPTYPIRGYAMVNAARLFVEDGQVERAIELVEGWEKESPDYQLPPQLTASLDEYRAARATATP